MIDMEPASQRDATPCPAVVYLIGYPGAGKLTVAKALAGLGDQPRRWKIIDSHYINNVIFELVEPDGITPIAEAVWERVEEVREAVLRTVETLSPPQLSFVFTNVLIADSAPDAQVFRRVAEMAVKRQSTFLPVQVTCDVSELERRIVNPDRRRAMKWVDGNGIRRYVDSTKLFDVRPYGGLHLDTTTLAPQDAVAKILTALKE